MKEKLLPQKCFWAWRKTRFRRLVSPQDEVRYRPMHRSRWSREVLPLRSSWIMNPSVERPVFPIYLAASWHLHSIAHCALSQKCSSMTLVSEVGGPNLPIGSKKIAATRNSTVFL